MITFVSTYKRTLRILWGLLAILCISLLVVARMGLDVQQVAGSRVQIVLFGFPFFLFGTVHLFLMYESWFHFAKAGTIALLKHTFFWLLTAIYVVILLGFIGYFVVSK